MSAGSALGLAVLGLVLVAHDVTSSVWRHLSPLAVCVLGLGVALRLVVILQGRSVLEFPVPFPHMNPEEAAGLLILGVGALALPSPQVSHADEKCRFVRGAWLFAVCLMAVLAFGWIWENTWPYDPSDFFGLKTAHLAMPAVLIAGAVFARALRDRRQSAVSNLRETPALVDAEPVDWWVSIRRRLCRPVPRFPAALGACVGIVILWGSISLAARLEFLPWLDPEGCISLLTAGAMTSVLLRRPPVPNSIAPSDSRASQG